MPDASIRAITDVEAAGGGHVEQPLEQRPAHAAAVAGTAPTYTESSTVVR